MHRIDINIKEDSYVVTFELPGVQEKDLTIIARDNEIRVVANPKNISMQLIADKNYHLDYSTIYYDKTAVLDDPDLSDLKKLKYTFFLGWLEVIVPRKC